MNFAEWKASAQERLRGFAVEAHRWSSGLLYGGLAASAIFPLVEATNQAAATGNLGLLLSIGSLAGSLVGGNLLAERISRWHDRTEAEIAQELAASAETDPAWRDALDKLLLELEAPRIVQAVLPERDWDRFQRLLQAELAELGNSQKYADTVLFDLRGQRVQNQQLFSSPVNGPVNVGHLGNIIHQYQNAPGAAQMGEEEFRQALERYLHWVETRYGHLDMRGIERRERQVLSLTIEDVYVSLQAAVRPQRQRPARRGTRQQAEEMLREEEQIQTIDMAQLLALGRRLAIIGGPGSGKTTFLRIIVSTLAQALRSGESGAVARTLGLHDDLPLPIFVSLSDYNRYRRGHENAADPRQGTLTSFITHTLIRQEAALSLPADFFQRLLIQGQRCIVLLDGLDEVADERERALVRGAVENLAANQGIRYLLVTSRSRAYRESAVLAEEFRVAEVQPMTLEQAQALAARWCWAAYDETQAEREAESLQRAIAGLEGLRQQRGEPGLVTSPLMVTIVAIVHYNQRRLPDERAKLYERCVEVLLAESYKPPSEAMFALVEWGGDETEKRNLLAWLAFCMMTAGAESGRSVAEAQLRRWLTPQLARRFAPAVVEQRLGLFVQAMRERGSLLDERDGVYQFIHLTFQEFLCAVYLVDSVREIDGMADVFCQEGRLADSWWRETLLLTVGYLGLRSTEAPLTLIAALVERSAHSAQALAALEVTSAAFLEQNGADPVTRELLVKRLVAHLTDPADRNTPLLRAAAGRVLGRLVDPRQGVGVVTRHGVSLPDIAWIDIPAGPFVMGGKESYTGGRQFTCHLITESYRIARYPVTVAQYDCFVRAGGYTEKGWWTEAGWAWREEGGVIGPQREREVFQTSNHPVVGVSWYEAVAYCGWLSDALGYRVELPSEAQWERAARHTDGRIYPWSGEFSSERCNMKDTGIGATSAVGIFPGGNAECGAADMAGNVWEWCRTVWLDDYTEYAQRVNDDLTEGDRRVLRGGSFSPDRNLVRCAVRLRASPVYGSGNLGFRLLSPGS